MIITALPRRELGITPNRGGRGPGGGIEFSNMRQIRMNAIPNRWSKAAVGEFRATSRRLNTVTVFGHILVTSLIRFSKLERNVKLLNA